MKFYSKIASKNNKNPSRVAILGIFSLSFLFISIISANTAHAGIFSFINSALGGEEASAKVETVKSTGNSQTMAILQPAVNIDPNPNKQLNSVPVDNKGVLVPEMSGVSLGDDEDNVNTQISVYTVHEGDTLSSIAKMFKVSVNTIVWANELRRSAPLKEGQVLVILPVTGVTHKVVKGDTIKGIVLKYKADLDEVLNYNDLTLSSTLTIGDEIIIPDGEAVQAPSNSRKYNTNNPAHDTNGPYYPGYYARPVVGGTRTQGLHGHNGIDIAGPVGTPIYASAAGTVIVSLSGGWGGGYGNFIIISHSNGTQTLYSHLSKNQVKVGQVVEKGQQIGLMGATGKATGSHLHFEIRGARNPF